jgi:CIC family chloride channel protein
MLRLGLPSDWFLIPLAAGIGALAGVAAEGYGQLVLLSERCFDHLLRGGSADVPSAAKLLVILLLPALGGLIVGLVKAVFALPTVSHGVPEVIESLARRGGQMPLRGAVFTALNSALTIGSGGSAGQEGPIIHIGSIIASGVGRLLRVSREHMATLVGCGAAAGLAAIFNAPIAGVLFVLEVLLRDFSFRTFMPIVIAAVFGVTVNQQFEHHYGALFPLSREHYVFTLHEVLPYLLLGVVCGAAAGAYSRGIDGLERLWVKVPAPRWLKPALGGLILGCMGVALLLAYPHAVPGYRLPAIFGNGYAVVIALLNPGSYGSAAGPGTAVAMGFVLFILAGKILGTGLTLGSGGSGGLFAPSLFVGAAAGSAYGLVLVKVGLLPGGSPASYALAGMAGVLGGAVHCPLTALILVMEITRDYDVILPVMLVAITATVVARLLCRESVYTLALREMGVRVGRFSDLTLLRRLAVADLPLAPAVVLRPEEPATRLLELTAQGVAADYVVCDGRGRYLGMVIGQDLRHALLSRDALPLMIVADLMRPDVRSVSPSDTLEAVLRELARHDLSSLAVVDSGQVRQLVTRAGLIRRYQQLLDEQP